MLIQKANRQLRVDENDGRAAELLKAGYREVDPATGKVKPTPEELEEMLKAAEVEALRKQVAELTEELAKATAKGAK